MLEEIIEELKNKWNLTNDQSQDIYNKVKNYSWLKYRQGYEDREEETKYYSGFTYSKNSDMDDYGH